MRAYSSSSSAFAATRSGVSKPSANPARRVLSFPPASSFARLSLRGRKCEKSGMRPALSRNSFVRSIALVVSVARRGEFPVALIGGFALPFHGVRRTTGDVDFLVEAAGSDALHEALLAAGARCLHRSPDAANYTGETSRLAPVDFVYARRPRARAMLRRARPASLRGARLRVPVVDAEALIGLKLQALVNAPSRRARDEADIEALVAAKGAALDAARLRDYYRLFGRERDLDRLLARLQTR